MKTVNIAKLFHFLKCDYSEWSEIIPCYQAPYQFRYCKQCNKIAQREVAISSTHVNLGMWNHVLDKGED